MLRLINSAIHITPLSPSIAFSYNYFILLFSLIFVTAQKPYRQIYYDLFRKYQIYPSNIGNPTWISATRDAYFP